MAKAPKELSPTDRLQSKIQALQEDLAKAEERRRRIAEELKEELRKDRERRLKAVVALLSENDLIAGFSTDVWQQSISAIADVLKKSSADLQAQIAESMPKQKVAPQAPQ